MKLFILIFIDQICKNFLYYDRKLNYGVSYGLFAYEWTRYFILLLIVVIATSYVFFMKKYIFLDFFFAGIISNGVDRAIYKGVLDIYYLPILCWFNIADIYIWFCTPMFYLIYRRRNVRNKII